MADSTFDVWQVLRKTFRDFAIIMPQAVSWSITGMFLLVSIGTIVLHLIDGPDYITIRALLLSYSETDIHTFPFVNDAGGVDNTASEHWWQVGSKVLPVGAVLFLLMYSASVPLLLLSLRKVLLAGASDRISYFGSWRQRVFWRLVGYETLVLGLVVILALLFIIFMVVSFIICFAFLAGVGFAANYELGFFIPKVETLDWYLSILSSACNLFLLAVVMGKLLVLNPLVILGEQSPMSKSWYLTKGHLPQVAGLALFTLCLNYLLVYLAVAIFSLVGNALLMLAIAVGSIWLVVSVMATWEGILAANAYLALRE